MDHVLPGTYEVLAAADFARRGVLPVAGGTLDQTSQATEAIRLVWKLESPHRAKANLPD